MFGLVSSRTLHQVYFCKRNAGDSTARLCFLVHDAVFGIRNWSSSLETVDRYAESKKSFAVSYLVNSCGFSLGDATVLSKHRKFAFDSPERSDSVLQFLRRNGFSDLDIRKVVRRCPQLMMSKGEPVLSPKVSFFRSLGLSGEDVVEMFTRNPLLFATSLKNRLTPWYSLLRSLIGQDAEVNRFLKCFPYILCLDPLCNVAPKISVLRETGVTDVSILRFLKYRSRAFGLTSARFCEIVKEVVDMGIDPATGNFINAFEVFQSTKATLDGRVDAYKEFGLSECEIWSMFKKNPEVLKLSQKLIKSKTGFLMNKMGFQLQNVSTNPSVLDYSLERRIIPRCSVIRVLQQKGLIKLRNPLSPLSALEQQFSKRYVEKDLDQVPDLLDIYQGKICPEDLNLGFGQKP